MVTIKVQFLLIAFLLFNYSYNAAMATENAGAKATQIYKLAKHVNWPPNNKVLTFCVMSASDVTDSLRNIIKGKKIVNHELQIGTSDCDVIFGSTSTSSGVLTISDGRGCGTVAIFDFYKENGSLEFSYSAAADKRSGLDIYSGALELAKKRC